jgi:hypothetical protein
MTKRAVCLALMLAVTPVQAQDWQPVTGANELTRIFSDTVMKATLAGDNQAVATYNADGTGSLSAWGDTFPREWKVEGEDRVCILIDQESRCFRIERDANNPVKYRAFRLDNDDTVTFTVNDRDLTIDQSSSSKSGGAAKPSADEVAKQLANPTNPVMTIGNNFDYVTFDGDLPGASSESSFRYVFQTVFPFKMKNGVLFFRPAIPVMFNEPIPAGSGGFDSVGTEIADIGYDLSYGATTPGGLIWGAGVAGTIPTATDDRLGKDLWGLGPELLLGVIREWGAVGGVLSHQWDVGGSGDGDINLTAINYFYAFFLDDGWQIAAGPSITYDHTRPSGDRWTIPLGFGVSKTAILGGRPWKFQLQYWNYVEAPDAFSAEHQVRLSINPVVSAPWNRGR